MSIQDLIECKEMKVVGEKLGRGKLSRRLEEILEHMSADKKNQGLWEGIGRLKRLIQAMEYDHYMVEKIETGYYKEYECLIEICDGNTPPYFGYRGKIKRDSDGKR